MLRKISRGRMPHCLIPRKRRLLPPTAVSCLLHSIYTVTCNTLYIHININNVRPQRRYVQIHQHQSRVAFAKVFSPQITLSSVMSMSNYCAVKSRHVFAFAFSLGSSPHHNHHHTSISASQSLHYNACCRNCAFFASTNENSPSDID
jgi:hypothetical protein